MIPASWFMPLGNLLPLGVGWTYWLASNRIHQKWWDVSNKMRLLKKACGFTLGFFLSRAPGLLTLGEASYHVIRRPCEWVLKCILAKLSLEMTAVTANTSISASWQTSSQNHPNKLLLHSLLTELWDKKCFLFPAQNWGGVICYTAKIMNTS